MRGLQHGDRVAIVEVREANVLVPTTTDPLSKTPAFKNVAITVTPEKAAPADERRALKLVGT